MTALSTIASSRLAGVRRGHDSTDRKSRSSLHGRRFSVHRRRCAGGRRGNGRSSRQRRLRGRLLRACEAPHPGNWSFGRQARSVTRRCPQTSAERSMRPCRISPMSKHLISSSTDSLRTSEICQIANRTQRLPLRRSSGTKRRVLGLSVRWVQLSAESVSLDRRRYGHAQQRRDE